ncbi:MAG TPA: hypothetical protein VF331_13695 [Polyangiales bacterium]
MRTRIHHRKQHLRANRDLKDRLIQARVPESLESTLKDEAKKRRLSVSHLIRNVLEDTFELVDGVVAEVDNLVQDSVGLAERVARDAGRIASHARRPLREPEEGLENEPPEPYQAAADGGDSDERGAAASRSTAARSEARGEAPRPPVSHEISLDHVLAWNKVVLNRECECAKCGAALAKGREAHLGLSQDPSAAPTWLCSACIAAL